MVSNERFTTLNILHLIFEKIIFIIILLHVFCKWLIYKLIKVEIHHRFNKSISFYFKGTVETFFAGIAQRTSAWFLTRTWWLRRESVIAASTTCRGFPNTCEHLTGWSTNDRSPMQLQTRASKQFWFIVKCVHKWYDENWYVKHIFSHAEWLTCVI